MRIPQGSRPSLIVLAVIVAGGLCGLGLLVHRAWFDPNVAYFASAGEASWIIEERFANLGQMSADGTTHRFSKQIDIPVVSGEVWIEVRAFRSYELFINGTATPAEAHESDNWKDTRRHNVASALEAGTNLVEVDVFNDYGPPALWLSSKGLAPALVSDDSWTVVVDERVVPAVRAADPESRARRWGAKSGIRLEDRRPIQTLPRTGWLLAIGFSLGLAAFRFRQRIRPAAARLGIGAPALAAVAFVILWAALFLNNAFKMRVHAYGFDVEGHVAYMDFIVRNGSLPGPKELWQSYHPPLFYVLAAPLSAAARELGQPNGRFLWKLIPFLAGVGQIGLSHLAARRLFPNDAKRQILTIACVALLPMNLYMSSYVSNETLSALLCSAVLVVALTLLTTKSDDAPLLLMLGTLAGLALLTKITVLALLPVVFACLLLSMSQRGVKAGSATSRLIQLGAVIAVVAGWWFVRNWVLVGELVSPNWQPSSGHTWWQDPRFGTLWYFARFGRSFSDPYFSGLASFWDGVYTTFWGDGIGGGRTAPWNYHFISVTFLMASVPTAIGAYGAILMGVRSFRERNLGLLMCLAWLAALLYALVLMNVSVPHYGMAKAFYMLPGVIPFAVMGATGVAATDEWLRSRPQRSWAWARALLWGWLVALTCTIVAGYTVR